jgi:mRNA interferase RelE/StbE
VLQTRLIQPKLLHRAEMRRGAARISARVTITSSTQSCLSVLDDPEYRPCASGVKSVAARGPAGSSECPMYQVTFSSQAMHELNQLDQLQQLDVVEPISGLKPDDLLHPREPLGRFTRAGKEFYRLRAGDFRFYFDAHGEKIHVNYILHKNSLEDFLLRNKLPVSEQQLVEQHSKFWKYLESLTKK